MKKVNVSIIVALYNTIEYLDSFFKCLNNQSLKEFEVVIVDDMSTDGSYEYAVKYRDEHPGMEINVIKSKEKLLPDMARKVAFSHCRGEYVIFLDSDDEFSNDYLEKLYSLAKENDLDFSVSSCQRIDEKGNKTNKVRYLSKKTIPLMSDKQKRCLIRGRYGGWNRMARRSFLIERGYDYLSAELPLFILQFDTNTKVGYTKEGCYFYRARGGSISTSKVPERIANYDILEPLEWLKNISISNTNKKALGVYLYRMILPYIYYKRYFVKEYEFKKDIKYVKKHCGYKFLSALRYWWILDTRDKIILPALMLHLHHAVFRFIKRYRS